MSTSCNIKITDLLMAGCNVKFLKPQFMLEDEYCGLESLTAFDVEVEFPIREEMVEEFWGRQNRFVFSAGSFYDKELQDEMPAFIVASCAFGPYGRSRMAIEPFLKALNIPYWEG